MERHTIKIAACSRVEKLDYQGTDCKLLSRAMFGVGGGLKAIIRNSMRERESEADSEVPSVPC